MDQEPSTSNPMSSMPNAASPGAERPRDEMRPVTSLFADIVGSTGLGERLEPDEVKALIGECVTRMSRAVEEFGGVIQAYMGDGICAYFGVPVAHEDDPERAARAALRIIRVVGEYARDIQTAWGLTDFNVRVGINSGQTAVGVVGAGAPQAVAMGDTTNVAARLQSAAAPGTIAVGELTAKRLGAHYELEPLGPVQVKGRAEPVHTSRLVGPRSTAAPVPAATPLVGRDVEMSRLATVVDELVSGRGQILFLVGEAGIGKSRLLAELRALGGERVTWLEGRCPSYGAEQPYSPFVEMLRSWLVLVEGEPDVAVRIKMRAKFGALLGERVDEAMPALARLLGVRLDLDAAADHAAPEELSRRIRSTYRLWLEALAERGPVVAAVDDLTWADPSTRELAEDLFDLTDRAPVLLAFAARPDPASEGWRLRLKVLTDYSHRAVEVPLQPLSAGAAEQLADSLVPPGLLDPATKRELAARAEGNPLYLEELMKALVETGLFDRRRTWTVSTNPADLLPPALESLLVARIDRLPPGPRALVQIAAVVGRTFSVRVVERVAGPADISADIGTLLRAEIVRELRRYPELECTFRHGLLQEAALSSLTPARRAELSTQVGLAVEELFAATLDEHLEELAFWFYRSDRQEKALEYLERAAERAAALDARDQAAELLTRAVRVAERTGNAEAATRASARLAELRGQAGVA